MRTEEEEEEGGVVGRPAAEKKGPLLRLDCSLSGDSEAAHSDRIWQKSGSKATFAAGIENDQRQITALMSVADFVYMHSLVKLHS